MKKRLYLTPRKYIIIKDAADDLVLAIATSTRDKLGNEKVINLKENTLLEFSDSNVWKMELHSAKIESSQTMVLLVRTYSSWNTRIKCQKFQQACGINRRTAV